MTISNLFYNSILKFYKKNNFNITTGAEVILTNKEQNSKKLDCFLSFLYSKFKRSKPTISVLRLNGIIGKSSSIKGSLNIEVLNELIERAFKVKKLAAVLLNINSPGGSPVQSELIAKRIISLSKKTGIPVYSFVEDVAASGGYWLACAGNEIYASKNSIIGSIGVIYSSFGFQHAIEKLGIERRVYTEGKNKSILDPFKPVKNEDIKIIQQLQKQIHQNFVDYVKIRRCGKLSQSDDVLFNGEFWAGQSALDLGLIDGIEDMYTFIKQKFGDDIKIEYIHIKQSWFKKKLGVYTNNNYQEVFKILLDSLQNSIIKSRFDIY